MQDPKLLTPEVDAQNPGGSEFDLRDILRVVGKHKWAIATLTVLVTLVAALFVMRQVPVYRATATLQIERAPVRFAPTQDAYSGYSDHWLYYQTQYGLIKRRAIGERVVDELELGQAVPKSSSDDSGFSWKDLFPEEWFPEPQAPSPDSWRESRIRWVVGGIQVEPKRDSQLVDVSFDSTSPELAARIANAVAKAYIQDNLEGHMDMAQAASSYLTDRLVELQQKVEQSERALQRFKEQESLIDVRGIDSLENQELSMATEKLSAARKERLQTEAIAAEVREARDQGAEALAALPTILSHPQVQPLNQAYLAAERKVNELAQRYGPKHPRMISARSELESAKGARDRQILAVADAALREYQAAVSAERAAQQELDAVKSRLREIDRKEFELLSLEREVEANRQIYEKFQTQFKETDATGGLQTANARIVEQALPPRSPIRPNKRRFIGIAFLLGLLGSIGLAFLLEHLDDTLKGADDVERRLGIPVLGLLPKLKTSSEDRLSPLRHFNEQPSSVFAESIRTVRTGVLLSALDDAHRVLLVTSSVPGEGKTTLSMNLARALGEMKRVLLIDADMRRPMVARASSGEARKGLSHFISGEAELSDCVVPVDGCDMHVMHAGMVPPNPLEMLSSQRFAKALDRLAEKFDHIVIDCAPVLAVSDAMVLSKLASSVIFVIRSDSTPVQAAQAGLKRLRRVGAHVIGTVINHAQRRSGAKYGKYGGYYGDSYYGDYGYVSDEQRKTA